MVNLKELGEWKKQFVLKIPLLTDEKLFNVKQRRIN